jgi:hypothetical protein
MQLLFLIQEKWNGQRQFAVMTGYSDEEMIGKTRDFTAETDMETVQYMREQILKGCLLVVKLLILKKEKNIG